jgi:CheY-like chemotaxis protein
MKSARVESSAPGARGLPSTVMIIEDDDQVREALADVVSQEGYKVATAQDGREALDKLRWGLRPAVILLDMQMPLMTGWDFRAEQRRDPELEQIPVVAITGGLRWKDEDADIAARLTKPIQVETLRAILRRYCA